MYKYVELSYVQATVCVWNKECNLLKLNTIRYICMSSECTLLHMGTDGQFRKCMISVFKFHDPSYCVVVCLSQSLFSKHT